VLLEGTVPVLDGVRAVVELCAATEDRAFALSRAGGVEEAVRHLASIYHDDQRFQRK
jgi:hypothetical protein